MPNVNTEVKTTNRVNVGIKTVKVSMPATDYKTVKMPGLGGATLGTCFVRVTDLPKTLDAYMSINPRVPNRNTVGLLSGPIAKGILETLREKPEEMALKNQGIYILTEQTMFAGGEIHMALKDVGKHGIINGGHTYAAIQEAIETATPEELTELKKAYVRLHILQGIDADYVPEIAEGLNRSKQVDEPSLANLQGEFDEIRRVLKGKPGADEVAYHQGDKGSVYVTELLVYMELFDIMRFDDKKHPNSLYNRHSLGLKFFIENGEEQPKLRRALVEKLPEFLALIDKIRLKVPEAARHNSFQFGRAKIGPSETRAGGATVKGVQLPFIGKKMNYRIPNGWLYPMVAAFRANLRWEKDGKQLEWIVPLDKLLPEVIDDLVGVCVKEHKENNMRPELIGKREGAYALCYTKVFLHLAKKKLLY